MISFVFFANVYWLYTEDWSFVTDRVINPGVGGLPMAQDAFIESTLFTDAGIWLVGLRSPSCWALSSGSRSAWRSRRATCPSRGG